MHNIEPYSEEFDSLFSFTSITAPASITGTARIGYSRGGIYNTSIDLGDISQFTYKFRATNLPAITPSDIPSSDAFLLEGDDLNNNKEELALLINNDAADVSKISDTAFVVNTANTSLVSEASRANEILDLQDAVSELSKTNTLSFYNQYTEENTPFGSHSYTSLLRLLNRQNRPP